MAKRKADSSAAEVRPSKKRKAAADSQARIRQIADAEVDEVAQERTELEEKTFWNDTTIEPEDEADGEVTRTISRPTFQLQTGEDIGAVAEWNYNASKYTQAVEISHDQPFALTQMRIHEGPLAGRTILVLDKPVEPFKFLDLPPEIRNIIYGYVMDISAETNMTCYKPNGLPRRPVRRSYVPGTYSRRGPRSGSGRTWDTANGRWLGETPSPFSLLQVSRFMLHETAAIAYGNSCYNFLHVGELDVFLSTIGAMRKHLRSVSIGHGGYRNNKARSAFNNLREARDLHTISIEHSVVCGSHHWDRSVPIERLIDDLKPLLCTLHNNHVISESDDGNDVLELIKLTNTRGKCYMCMRDPKGECARTSGPSGFCNTHCDKLDEHHDEVKRKIRGMVAKVLGIEDE